MSEQEFYKRVIAKNAPLALAIQEKAVWYKRIDKRSLTYEWFCRGCCEWNSFEVFQAEPLLVIVCGKCGLKIERGNANADWVYYLPVPKKKENLK